MTRGFCVIPEETELLTDIGDFTTLFYMIFKRGPPNGQGRLSNVLKVCDLQYGALT